MRKILNFFGLVGLIIVIFLINFSYGEEYCTGLYRNFTNHVENGDNCHDYFVSTDNYDSNASPNAFLGYIYKRQRNGSTKFNFFGNQTDRTAYPSDSFAGHNLVGQLGAIYTSSMPGTIPLYDTQAWRCDRAYDHALSTDSNMITSDGVYQNNGIVGYIWTSKQACEDSMSASTCSQKGFSDRSTCIALAGSNASMVNYCGVMYATSMLSCHNTKFSPGTCYSVPECQNSCFDIVSSMWNAGGHVGGFNAGVITIINLNTCNQFCVDNVGASCESNIQPPPTSSSCSGLPDQNPITRNDGSVDVCTKHHETCYDKCPDGNGGEVDCNPHECDLCQNPGYVCGYDYSKTQCEVSWGEGWQGDDLTCRTKYTYNPVRCSCFVDGGGCPTADVPIPTPHCQKYNGVNLNIVGSNCDPAGYANNSDSCGVSINLDGNPDGGLHGAISTVGDEIHFFPNSPCWDQMSNPSCAGYMYFPGQYTFSEDSRSFTINGFSSKIPFSQDGNVSFYVNSVSAPQNNVYYFSKSTHMTFQKPMTGVLKPFLDNGISTPLRLGIYQKIAADITPLVSLNGFVDSSLNVLKLVDSFRLQDAYTNFTLTKNTSERYDGIFYNNNFLPNISEAVGFLVNYVSNKSFDSAGNYGFEASPYVKYNIGGQDVTYRLTPSSNPGDTDPITLVGGEYLTIKVLGLTQSVGRQNKAVDNYKTSTLQTSQVRANVRSHVLTLVRSMKNNDKQDGLLFLDFSDASTKYKTFSSFSSSDLDGVKTIVIKNGNFVIDQDMPIMYGIIMINESDDTKLGNVFVTSNVKYVNSLIYADGSFVSAYDDNSIKNSDIGYDITKFASGPKRTDTLRQQMVFKGALFSKNTIGGSILTDSHRYILPGGAELPVDSAGSQTNYNTALKYDLAFFRTGKESPVVNYNQGYNNYSMVLIFDSSYQKNPPIGFDF